MRTRIPTVRWVAFNFAALLNVSAALWLAYLAHLFTYLTIGFSSRNQAPWFTNRDIITIVVADTIAALILAIVASKVLLFTNRLLKLESKFASALSSLVFVFIGFAVLIAFLQGFRAFA
jgi:hypothetical protein